MKGLEICSKCNSHNVKKLKGNTFRAEGIKIKFINLSYYMCTRCGYTEIYVEDDKDLKYVEDNC